MFAFVFVQSAFCMAWNVIEVLGLRGAVLPASDTILDALCILFELYLYCICTCMWPDSDTIWRGCDTLRMWSQGQRRDQKGEKLQIWGCNWGITITIMVIQIGITMTEMHVAIQNTLLTRTRNYCEVWVANCHFRDYYLVKNRAKKSWHG